MRVAALAVAGLVTLSMTAEASTSTTSGPASGFYARFGLGVGWSQVTSKIAVPQNDWSVEYDGVGWMLDVMAGGTIEGWLAVGGGLFLMEMPAPAIEADPGRVTFHEALSQGRLGMGTLGPTVDVLLGPRGEGYVGLMGGVGRIEFDEAAGGPSHGWSLGLRGGYDLRLSDAWIAGVSLRYLYIHGTRDVQANPATTQPGTIAATAEDSASTLGLLFNVAYR